MCLTRHTNSLAMGMILLRMVYMNSSQTNQFPSINGFWRYSHSNQSLLPPTPVVTSSSHHSSHQRSSPNAKCGMRSQLSHPLHQSPTCSNPAFKSKRLKSSPASSQILTHQILLVILDYIFPAQTRANGTSLV